MVTSGNVTKYVYYTNMNNIYMVYWYIVVVLVKLSFWFNSYIISQTSVELTADKMQSLLTKQKPEGAYNTDLHELQKNCHLNYYMTEQIGKLHFPNKYILCMRYQYIPN